MSKKPSLLPCAFCGSAAHFESDSDGWHWVECESCGMQGNRGASLMEDCKPTLAEAWNRRTPQPVNLGFTIENRAGIDVLVWEAGGCQPATSAEVAMWKALSAVQQPVVREPLTPSQYNIALGCATDIPPSRYEAVTRAIERAHGITQKGGSNAE